MKILGGSELGQSSDITNKLGRSSDIANSGDSAAAKNDSVVVNNNFHSPHFTLDAAQIAVVDQLKNLAQKLEKSAKTASLFGKIINKFSKTPAREPSGLYIYGKVGRGKSMLMADFFQKVAIKQKTYFHFLDFMQRIHRQLYHLRKDASEQDLIARAVDNILSDADLLCLDEFQVEDVADAMILNRVFSYIFLRGVTVVFTSNSHPQNLYLNGLQREIFLKFIDEVLNKNCQIINLDGKIDYRSQYLQSIKKYYFAPLNEKNKQEILNIFAKITDNEPAFEVEIEVLGRKLAVKKTYKNIALFDFDELCRENLGPADYQAICQKFNIIFLLNIPKLPPEDRNEARRLILFIDEIYENKVALLVSAATAPEEIYEEGMGAEAFRRTASRLNEITSDQYYNQARLK